MGKKITRKLKTSVSKKQGVIQVADYSREELQDKCCTNGLANQHQFAHGLDTIWI